jgi:hypothetical protein
MRTRIALCLFALLLAGCGGKLIPSLPPQASTSITQSAITPFLSAPQGGWIPTPKGVVATISHIPASLGRLSICGFGITNALCNPNSPKPPNTGAPGNYWMALPEHCVHALCTAQVRMLSVAQRSGGDTGLIAATKNGKTRVLNLASALQITLSSPDGKFKKNTNPSVGPIGGWVYGVFKAPEIVRVRTRCQGAVKHCTVALVVVHSSLPLFGARKHQHSLRSLQQNRVQSRTSESGGV